MSQNYYETLGVKKVASSDDIKGAFRKKAMEYHPDRNEGDVAAEEMFKKVNDAYSVLGDPEKRKMYDSGVDPNQNGPGPGGFGGFGGFNGNPNSFSDLFSKFNMGFGGHGPLETCKHCGGRGMVAEQRGNTQMIAPCPICRGTGKMMKDVCDKCGGTGHTETKTRKLIIKIKPGIKPGERLIMQGAGIPDKSGVFGPLVVNIDIIFPDKSSFSNEEKDILQKILNK
jgi:molecular chaperone DnaJ